MYSCQSKPAEGRDVNEGGPDGVQLPLWALHNPPSHWLTDWQLHIPPHPRLSLSLSPPLTSQFHYLGFASYWDVESDIGGNFCHFHFHLDKCEERKKERKNTLSGIWRTARRKKSESELMLTTNFFTICDPQLKSKTKSPIQAASVSLPPLNMIFSFPIIREWEFQQLSGPRDTLSCLLSINLW